MFDAKRNYADYTSTAPLLFERLANAELQDFETTARLRQKAGIYVLFEDGVPVYVGRTRNLQQRFRAHVTRNHNSASFALKRTRAKHPEIQKASYKKADSRQAIVDHELYGETFKSEIVAIRIMKFKFLEVSDPIDQYLLELFATMELNLNLSGFDSH
jgi:hypothetical protein